MKRFLLCCLIIFCISNVQSQEYFRLRSGISSSEYKANTIVFKVKPQYRNHCSSNAISEPKLNATLKQIGAKQITKTFPNERPVGNERSALGLPLVDLTLIYRIQYSSAYTLEKAINALLATGELIYAEPCYIAKPFCEPPPPPPIYTTNDPYAVDSVQYQYYLAKIQANQAWDVNKGDSTILIGILDTGTDPNHPDLKGNMVPGWNFESNNNDPSDVTGDAGHGTAVCGIAAARTDNKIGIAGVGFKCKFMPIKMDFSNPYQSVKYAADNGCTVINCSWGHIDYSLFGEDIVNYATSKGALVVGASGNNGDAEIFYPSAYDNAMGVGATFSTDQRANFSDYNYTVDIMAPGVNIFTTAYNGQYTGGQSGTSFASPIVAAGAALIKSQFPSYGPLQLREQLRVTADNIDTVKYNTPYAHKMGHGRINLYNALTVSSPSIRWINRAISDKNDSVFTVGDTLRLSGDFKNYLTIANNLTITISCADPNVTILSDSIFTVGTLASLAVANNTSNPFRIKVNPGTPPNTKLAIKLAYKGTGYTDEEWIEVIIQPDFMDLVISDIATTITTNGRLGYNDHQVNGLGFIYKNNGEQLIYEMSLMVGVPRRNVSDGVDGIYPAPDNDFLDQVALKRVIPPVKSDIELDCRFSDSLSAADVGKLQINVHQKTLAWISSIDRNYYILQYTITNRSNHTYDSLFAGIYADWNIATGNNKTDVDTALQLGYTYDPSGNYTYTGVKLMTGKGFHSYGIDNLPPGACNTGVYGYNYNYTSKNKFITLSTNRYQAGQCGNDVAQVVSSGPYHMAPNDSVNISFIVMAADNLNQLKQTAVHAVSKYTTVVEMAQQYEGTQLVFPNPTSNEVNFRFNNSASGIVIVNIYNVTGQLMKMVNINYLSQGIQEIKVPINYLNDGLYLYQITTNMGVFNGKFIVNK